MTYGTSNNAKGPNGSAENSLQALSCFLEGLSPHERDQSRTAILAKLNLLENDTIPVFDEATQNISRLLAMPICILSVIDTDWQRFKSVVGLSSLGLMNQLAAARTLPRKESFCTQVVDSGKTFVLENTTSHPAFSGSLLVQKYGIQSYLGVPLVTTEGSCIGTLAVMDLLPHKFTQQEIALLELSARWSMSEFEKQRALQALQQSELTTRSTLTAGDRNESPLLAKVNQVRFDLIVQLTQDLRNPLTSVTGMASMLSREIYGPLSEKQQEYAKIVLSSSQQLLTMVNEIVEIGDLKEEDYQLTVATADIEMIGQQAFASLENIAKQQDLQLKLTVEPGSRIWNLDKRVVKQLIYHLVFSIIKMSTAGSTIRLHVSRKDDSANLALWVSNPWLGEDLPQAVIAWDQAQMASASQGQQPSAAPVFASPQPPVEGAGATETGEVFEALATAKKVDASRQELGLLLSRHLTEMHGGEATVQGSDASGYRYIISLPSLAPTR
ncbi:MAG: GAF domain-containing sensor histidine kinase [Cyanobacteria bacterium J06614_10]